MKTTTKDIFKNILSIITILGLIGFFISKSINNKANEQIKQEQIKQEQTKIKQDKIKQDINASIQQKIKLTNAVTNWTSTLSVGDSFIFRKIFTYELEKLWLVDSPILFVGDIDDIKIKNDKEYILIINLDLFSSSEVIFDADIRLFLSAPRSIIDSFIKDNPEAKNGIFSNVTVIAKINSVDSTNMLGIDDNEEKLKIKNGYGNMLHIEFLGEYYKMFSN